MILGLTGSVGSGKSTVADMLRQVADAVIIDADALVHDMQRPGQDCFRAIVAEFGPGILAADGTLDRKKLGGLVFNNPDQLAKLNAIVHPRVWVAMEQETKRFESHPLVVLMVPLLYEIKAHRMCDAVAAVTVNQHEQIRRLQQRDGLTPDQIRSRIQAQMPQQEKAARADYVIDNSGTLEETLSQVRAMVDQLGVKTAEN